MGAAGSIGRPVRRREDERILSGRSEFLDDIRLEGMAHMAFVRSPHAHARVLGVRGALWTASEIAGHAAPARVDAPPGLTVADAPHPVLAGEEVRYVGQPVAVVVGETRAEAEDAVDRVEVDYEVLPPVLDPRAGPELARWEQRAPLRYSLVVTRRARGAWAPLAGSTTRTRWSASLLFCSQSSL